MEPSSRTVLVTAFEPFGGERTNASELAARPLHGRVIGGHEVVVEILPCRFDTASRALAEAMARARPALVVACGEAGDRADIALERVAINVDDARIADNAGARPIDRAIEDGGPVGRWSTLPLKAIGARLAARGIPVSMSQSAGTFVCNHVFYRLMGALERQPGVRGGFVHVPRAPGAPGGPSLPTATVTEALALVVEVSLAAAAPPISVA